MRVSRIVALVAFVSVAAAAAQAQSPKSPPSQAQMAAMSDTQFTAFLGAIPSRHQAANGAAAKDGAPCPIMDNDGILSAFMNFFGGMFGGL